MALKPWYKVVTPREDLRQQRPLDAAEFAVHLDQVRDGRAPSVYQNPDFFFDRTYLTRKLTELGIEVVRRLSGEVNDASAVFNLATQFGGGKTHALTMLYHLATYGQESSRWRGVAQIVEAAHVPFVPQARTAIFVGQQFDSIRGRGGEDGTPLRKTPWGEIAFQLGGEQSFKIVAEHDERGIAPGGDVIRDMIPADMPSLILMDEVMNYVNHCRRLGLASQFYNFIQNLSEEARSRRSVALVVSIPASELEMSADDERDYQSIKKLLDRLGKALIISAEHETSEIIRRRLFEWHGIPDEGQKTIKAYARWVTDNHQLIAENWSREKAIEAFAASYPFHPTALSVFERKWQALPRFQRTRGVLQLLARWVAKAYADGYSGAQNDPLIDLGTAPLDDPDFRAAVFEQLGQERLEAAVTTDIAGKFNSHATALDQDPEVAETLRNHRLHRKTATAIFFESNGGQTSRMEATIPEVRLAVGYPELDAGNIETVLEQLSERCYYLMVDRNRYKFSTRENWIKKHADYRANIPEQRVQEYVESEIQREFDRSRALRELGSNSAIELVFFPRTSNDVIHVPQITLVVLSPNEVFADTSSVEKVTAWTRDYGNQTRIFKNALIWCVAEDSSQLRDHAKKALAWVDIWDEVQSSPHVLSSLDEQQHRQLTEFRKKSQADLREAIWRTYRHIILLGRDGNLKAIDLGLVHSSAAPTPINVIINRLMQQGDVEASVGPNFLLRNWPPALVEWDTKSIRNAFFASAQFPRLLNAQIVRETIAKGISSGQLAYVSAPIDGTCEVFLYKTSREVHPSEIEISDEMFVIRSDAAESYLTSHNADEEEHSHSLDESLSETASDPDHTENWTVSAVNELQEVVGDAAKVRWQGILPPQKWNLFYNKVLSRFAVNQNLHLEVHFTAEPQEGVSAQKLEETKLALRELGLSDDLETS
jgi:predicted DCC family thiol-disulfide oxidoreductase YuxK